MSENYQMEYAVHFCTALRTLEEKLRDTEDSHTLINRFLQAAAEFYDADRAYIIESDGKENIGVNSYEWCKDGVTYRSNTLQYWEIEHLPFWTTALKKNEPIVIQTIQELQYTMPDAYNFFSRHGVHSLLAVPFSKRLNQGYIGVDNPRRYGDEAAFLFLIAYIVVQELNELKLAKCLTAATQALRLPTNSARISCFGGLTVEGCKGTLTEADFTSTQCYAMLAYLAVAENNSATAAKLALIIWPDESCETPAKSVRNIAYRLCSFLSYAGLEKLVIFSNGIYRLNPEMKVVIDVKLFEDLCNRMEEITDIDNRQKLYEEAVKLYKGNLLPRLADNINFLPHITYYQGLFINLTSWYIEHQIVEKQYIHAHRAAKDALDLDPYNGNMNMYLTILIYIQFGVGSAKTYFASIEDTLSEEQIARIKKSCPKLMI